MEEEKVMDYLEWSNDYERKYNLMPAWWWNQYMRTQARLLQLYEEAIDMGMTEEDAKVWAWDKFYSWTGD
mgnify:CR=1 FL=1